MNSHRFSYKIYLQNILFYPKKFLIIQIYGITYISFKNECMMANQWDPRQYGKFEKERSQPFFDLLHLIQPMHHPRILDLGCGNGLLTKTLHEWLHASYTLGIDSSKEMLAHANSLHTSSLIFEQKEIQNFTAPKQFDLVISNAALHWVPDHQILFKKLLPLLAPGGQIAIQMPANQNSMTHQIASELAQEEPFKHSDHPPGPDYQILSLEDYGYLLEKLGFESQNIRLQLYTHFFESTASVVEWMKGSLLSFYKGYLSPPLYDAFLNEYRKRLIERLGWSEPFFFMIKRILIWAQLPHH